MSAFKALKNISKNFEEELQRVSNDLCSAKIDESFEEIITKKLRDLSVYNAKLRFLRAKPQCLNPQVSEQDRDDETTLEAYGKAVAARIIEQKVVKSATQAHGVKDLITAPDSTLSPEMVDKKEKILAASSTYGMKEATIQHLDALLKKKEARLKETRERWHRELGLLRDSTGVGGRDLEIDYNNALYQKLSATVKKLELMRWMVACLGVPRSRGYDWLADPHRRLQALMLARNRYSVDQFLHTA